MNDSRGRLPGIRPAPILGAVRRWYIWLPISLGLLGLVVWRTRPWEAAALASQLDVRPLLLAAALNVVVVLLWAERSRSLMAAVGSPLPTTTLIPVTSLANTLNNLTPASSGEIMRALILRRRFGVPYPRSTAVIVIERLWAIGLMLVSALAASVGVLVASNPPLVLVAWLVAVAAAFAPSALYALELRPGRLLGRWARPDGEAAAASRGGRVVRALVEVDELLDGVLTSASRSVHFVASTSLIFLVFAVQLWLVLIALHADVSLPGAWAALGLATIGGVLSALPFGLGAADVVIVVLLGLQGVDAAGAGAAALLLRATATLPLGILGTASWIWLTRGGDLPGSAEAAVIGQGGPIEGTG
jgi:glycosyltransferase 2 family protein